MNKLSTKHHRRLKFGPKGHPLASEKLGNENGQVKFKSVKHERNGRLVSAPQSRKTPCLVGM